MLPTKEFNEVWRGKPPAQAGSDIPRLLNEHMKGNAVHELSIVTYVINQVEDLAKENALSKISSVTLEFGEVSGIVPEYLTDCWNWYVKKTPLMEGAVLRSEIIPALTWCDNCKSSYPTVEYGKTCPHCGSGDTWLQQGNEMNIKEIEAM